ncbi:MAG: hypothetical protein QW331_03500 [Candidatus Woesearchaeota archaeon]
MKKLIFVFLFLLLLAGANAGAEDEEENEKTLLAEVGKEAIVAALPSILEFVLDVLTKVLTIIQDIVVQIITTEIILEKVFPVYTKILILATFGILGVIVYTGWLWLFSSIDIEKRIEAKEQTLHLIYLSIGLAISYPIIKISLELSNGITLYISEITKSLEQNLLVQNFGTIVAAAGAVWAGLISMGTLIAVFSAILYFMGSFLLRIFIRHILNVVLILASPLILILFYLKPTREYGKKGIHLLFTNMFFSVVWLLVYAGGGIAATSLPGGSLFSFLYGPFILAAIIYLNTRLYDNFVLNSTGFGTSKNVAVSAMKNLYQRATHAIKGA